MKMLAIIKKELQTYFFSPVAYIVFAAFLMVTGYMFAVMLLHFKLGTLEPLFGNVAFLLLLASPILTMRLISEERRSNTLELLLTSPISAVEVVLGKFLACLFLYVVLLLLTLQFPFLLTRYATGVDLGPVVSGYLGLLLLGSAYISFGLFASSLSDNQIVSAIVSFGGLILFWVFGWASYVMDTPASRLLQQISLLDRYQQFVRGVVDSGNVVFYVAFTLVWLLVTTRILESQRWR